MNKKILRTLTALCAALMLSGGFSVTAFAQTPEGEDDTNDSGVVYACIAHTVKKRVELPPLRVLLRRRFQKELVYGYIVAEHKLKENL